MRSAAIVITVLSGHLWAAAVWNVFTLAMPRQGGELVTGGAVMTGIIASVLWKARADSRRGDSLTLLAQTVADTTRPAGVRATGPLRRVK